MAPIVVRYPLDPTGTSPDNLVANEPHTLGSRTVRAFATNYGGFYTSSIIVKDVDNNRNLIRGTDFYPAELYEVPTLKYNKEVCSVIVITNQNVSSNITITYQAVGGPWSTSQQAIIQMMESLEGDDRPVTWPNIIGKPAEFTPAHHLHDAGDIYGFEYIVAELERIRQAILMGDSASHEEIYRYIDDSIDHFESLVNSLEQTVNAHVSITNGNPHGTTKAHVGLSEVLNYGMATKAQAEAGALNTAYMSPLRTGEAIAAQADVVAARNHVAITNGNPHGTTAASTGGLTANLNFSDVPNKATARNNLEVYSKTEIDALVPAGTVIYVARDTAPAGYLAMSGQAVSRTQYARLFAAIGTRFGSGNGSTTFNLPDVRGDFIRCWDNGRGVDSGRTLGSWQAESMATHVHQWYMGGYGSGSRIDATGAGGGAGTYGSNGAQQSITGDELYGDRFTSTNNKISGETVPRNSAFLACIKT